MQLIANVALWLLAVAFGIVLGASAETSSSWSSCVKLLRRVAQGREVRYVSGFG
jgi:hypothetical protein